MAMCGTYSLYIVVPENSRSKNGKKCAIFSHLSLFLNFQDT